MGYITKTSDYWIAPNAVTITLNALGEANRTQGSVASGAVISCYVADIHPASEGSEYAGNGDGLLLDNGRNPKRWPLSLSPTYFNSDTEKYVYAAIPRSSTIGSQAVIVFPSEQIDIYGKNGSDEQIGSTDYFYIYLNGIISAVYTDESNTMRRRWTKDPKDNWGTLGTYEDLVKVNDSDWYRWDAVTQLTTFLKNLTMADGTTFLKLFAEDVQAKIIHGVQQLVFGSGEGAQPLTGVATKANATNIPEESTQHIVTPSYLDEFGNTRYLSKIHDDTAAGIITFLQGIKFGSEDSPFGIDGGGTANLYDIIFHHVLKSLGARKGFQDGNGIYMDADEGLIETDGLNVRGFMRVMELIINRLQLMESDYSFTEGDTVERVDYHIDPQTLAFDGTLLLTMHKDHDNDYTPFYPGDIIYGIKNDLLPKDGTVPDGHSVTRHGASYFHTWMRVISVDLTKNQLRVALYPGRRSVGTDESGLPLYEAVVPGGTNFSPEGTHPIGTDTTEPLFAEYDEHDGQGWDTMLTVTRHGNVADGIDPETGLYDEQIHQSQLGRQQAWVLSTTDQRLTYFWRVDQPIVREDNVSLCLGLLPQLLENVIPATHDWSRPSLYISRIYYEDALKVRYPARIVKEDRGQWSALPTTEYPIEYSEGTWTPDLSVRGDRPEDAADTNEYRQHLGYDGRLDGGEAGRSVTVHGRDVIVEPYHYRTFTRARWLNRRLDTHLLGNDAHIERQMLIEWKDDLEVSRVWHNGIVWECLVDGTTQEPTWGCTDWQPIGGDTIYYCEITSSAGSTFRNGNVDTVLTMEVRYGQEEITDRLAQQAGASVVWGRETGWDAATHRFTPTSEDQQWTPTPVSGQPYSISLKRSDMGSGWMTDYRQARFHCSIYAPDNSGDTEEYPADFITAI